MTMTNNLFSSSTTITASRSSNSESRINSKPISSHSICPDDETLPPNEDVPFDCKEEDLLREEKKTDDCTTTAGNYTSDFAKEDSISNSNDNSNSNTATARPVKISVIHNTHREAKDAVGDAIESLEQLNEKISRDKDSDLNKKATTTTTTEEEADSEEDSVAINPHPHARKVTKDSDTDSDSEEDGVSHSSVSEDSSAATSTNDKETSAKSSTCTTATAAATATATATIKNNKSRGFFESFFHSNISRPIVMSTGNKTRVAERLTAASNKSTEVNRSGELDNLKQKFETFTKQFKPFIGSLKNYHAAVVALEYNRSEVLQQIETWSKDTPLYEAAGSGNTVVSATPAWAKTFSQQDQSYCSMERQMSALNNNYANQLMEYCVEYVQEWEIIVTTRIKSNLKQAEDLRKDLLHYEKKVKGLLDNEAKMAERNKELNDKEKEKLKRNQEKLDQARQDFDKYATMVCHIIDSALQLAWMDVTPLVYRLANMELDRLGGKEGAEAFTNSLHDLVEKLKAVANKFEIDMTLPDQTAKPAPASASKPVTPKRTKSRDAPSSKASSSTKSEDTASKAATKSPKRLFGSGNSSSAPSTPQKTAENSK